MADLLNEIPRCCSSCEYLYNNTTDEPCNSCERNDKWCANSYLRHLNDIKKGNKHG